jgi:hypothetical protein
MAAAQMRVLPVGPLGLLRGLVVAVLSGIAVTRGTTKGATRRRRARVRCPRVGYRHSVRQRFGTFVARNTNVFTTFDNCMTCLANDIRS